jgi:hypothetical protein
MAEGKIPVKEPLFDLRVPRSGVAKFRRHIGNGLR